MLFIKRKGVRYIRKLHEDGMGNQKLAQDHRRYARPPLGRDQPHASCVGVIAVLLFIDLFEDAVFFDPLLFSGMGLAFFHHHARDGPP